MDKNELNSDVFFPENVKKSTNQQVHVTGRNLKNLIYEEKNNAQ